MRGSEQKIGMKVLVHLEKPRSKKGVRNLAKSLRKIAHTPVYKPLSPSLFMEFSEVNTPQKFAQFIFSYFGASEDGTTYCIRYWRNKTHWSRRLKRLAMIKLYDIGDGEFKCDFIDMKNIRRFAWFKG